MAPNRIGRSLALVVLASMLVGCTPQLEELPLEAPESTAEHSPASAAAPHDADRPPASSAVASEATTIAAVVMTAFCQPTLDRETWIDGLYPFLSQSAAAAYETVNPARVPCTKVTGDARVRDGDGTFTVRVIVPTDSGNYVTYVHRPEVADPWLVEQITPMAGK